VSLNTAFEAGIHFFTAEKPSVKAVPKPRITACLQCVARRWKSAVSCSLARSGFRRRWPYGQHSSGSTVSRGCNNECQNCLSKWKFGRKM